MADTGRYSFYVEQEALQVSDRPRRFLRAFAAVLEHSNYAPVLDTYARLASRCGRCADACQVYRTSGEERDQPCNRSERLLRIYRRYFTTAGRLKARLLGGWSLTGEELDRLAEEAYRCTACRRCRRACPMDIDHGLVTHLSRWLLAETGLVPKALAAAVKEQLEGVGNTSAIPLPALADTLEFLTEDAEDEYGLTLEFPLERKDAEYVFFPAVSDFLLEPDTLTGNALVMHCTGDSWTIGKGNYDGINYGLFYSDRVLEQVAANLVAETRRLGGRNILIGECGHATRSAWYVPSFAGREAPPVVSCLEHTARALREGKIPLKADPVPERVLYHDPCNIARDGRLVDEPREILRRLCADFVDPEPRGKENLCCGGGGGTVSLDEIKDFRMNVSGRLKAEQIRASGARIVVSPCANCKKQLRELVETHGLEGVAVMGLHELLLKAVDFDRLRGEKGEAVRA